MNPGIMVNPGQPEYDAYGKPLPGGPQLGPVNMPGGGGGVVRQPVMGQPIMQPPPQMQPPRFNLPSPVPDLRYQQPPAINLNTTPGQLGNQVPPPAAGMGGTGPLGSAPPAIGGGGMTAPPGMEIRTMDNPYGYSFANGDVVPGSGYSGMMNQPGGGGGIMNLPGGGGGGFADLFKNLSPEQLADLRNPSYGGFIRPA
jgi:hypothetical protein